MLRRFFMWMTVASLGIFAVCRLVLSVYSQFFGAVWTFGTPGNIHTTLIGGVPVPGLNLYSVLEAALQISLPLAAISAAIYIYLAEQKLMQINHSGGFEVLPPEALREDSDVPK